MCRRPVLRGECGHTTPPFSQLAFMWHDCIAARSDEVTSRRLQIVRGKWRAGDVQSVAGAVQRLTSSSWVALVIVATMNDSSSMEYLPGRGLRESHWAREHHTHPTRPRTRRPVRQQTGQAGSQIAALIAQTQYRPSCHYRRGCQRLQLQTWHRVLTSGRAHVATPQHIGVHTLIAHGGAILELWLREQLATPWHRCGRPCPA